MSELDKKLYIKDSSGNIVACKLFTTTKETIYSYMPIIVDNVQAYVGLGATNDTFATAGRVTYGNNKAILSQVKPGPSSLVWTTPGVYVFTVPSGVIRIRVAICGGGGGGAIGLGTAYWGSDGSEADRNIITSIDWATATGGTGGTTSISSGATVITASGGGGGYIHSCNGEHSGDTYTGGTAGSPNGRAGAGYHDYIGTYGGGTGFGLSFDLTNGGYGQGGGVSYPHNLSSRWPCEATGGSGGFNSTYLDVSVGQTFIVTVGGGGAAAASGEFTDSATSDYSRLTSTPGANGFAMITYGGDI